MATEWSATPGLSIAQLLWETAPDAPFVDARALIVSPRDPDAWLGALHRGDWPTAHGFHLFRDVATETGTTWTGFALLPRGCEALADDARAALLARVEATIDRHAPGFSAAIRYRRCFDAHDYRDRHGVSPALSSAIPAAATLPASEIEPGLYRIGNGVGPPGEHANAAMLSGRWAAERAHAHLTTT